MADHSSGCPAKANNEKEITPAETGPADPVPLKKEDVGAGEEEEEDEDIDALIEELESMDGHVDDDEEEEAAAGGARIVGEEYLATDTRLGLSEGGVIMRR